MVIRGVGLIGLVGALSVAAHPAARAQGTLGGANWSPSQLVDVDPGRIDPQIAAGPHHVLITSYDLVHYFDKSGSRITHVRNDPKKDPLVTSLPELFAPLRADINRNLFLPGDAPCNLAQPTVSKYLVGGNIVFNYCLDKFAYDARVLFDEQRQRFVIVAVAINSAAKCKYQPGAANVRARRNKILVAYSATADPTDGKPWQLTWFDAVPGESCATQRCREEANWRPGSASDYPVVAVAGDFLMVSINNQMHEPLPGDRCPVPVEGKPAYEDGFDALPTTVHVWNTRALATGKRDRDTCNGLCSWVYHDGDVTDSFALPVTGIPTLGSAHGAPYLDSAWFADRDGTGSLHLWHFSVKGSSTRPKLHHQRVQVPGFAKLDFLNTYGGPGHAPLLVNNTSALVQRGHHLFYADVGTSFASFSASIRLVALDGDSIANFTLRRHAIFGEPLQGYGSPALEVNENNDMVLTYRKVGQTAAPGFGARFLVWKSGTAKQPGGRTLADDEANLRCESASCPARGDFDTAGISLAPGGRVYLMQPFIESNREWAYAVNFVVP